MKNEGRTIEAVKGWQKQSRKVWRQEGGGRVSTCHWVSKLDRVGLSLCHRCVVPALDGIL